MKRNYLIFILSAVLFFGSLVTTLDGIAQRDVDLRGYANASVDPNLPYRLPHFGVNAELTQYDDTALDHNLDLMDQAHVVWIRQIVRWSDVERVRGHFDWGSTDRIFSTLKRHPSLKPVIVLTDGPAWARPIQITPTAPPVDVAAFTEFVSAFAARYAQHVDYYQIWDEPNLTAAWGDQEPNAAAYTALLAPVYQRIHQIDPVATVIAAALAPTTETGPKNISDIQYLRDMYAVGAKDFMDAVAAKPYGFDESPLDRTVAPDRLNFSRIIALREEMVKNGDAKKTLWASEWGWNALPESWSGQPSIWGSVTLQTQIQYTLDALDRVEKEWPWLAGMTLNHWQPAAPPDDPRWGFAIVDTANQPGALWQALAAYQVEDTATNGLFAAVNPYTQYSGVWTFGPLGADIGWVQDSQFAFKFHGADVSLLLRQNNYTAYLYPTVDGQPANAVPTDASGHSYIVLTSPSLLPETNLVPVAKNLSDSVHALHVIADRGWDQWAIAGFGVSSGDRSLPYEHSIAIGWLTTLFAGLAALVAAASIRWDVLQRLLHKVNGYLNATLQFVLGIVSSIALLIGMLITWGDGVTGVLRHEPISLLVALATSGLIKLQPGFMVAILAAGVLFVVFFNYPHIGLALTIFYAPFFLFPVELFRFAFPMAEMMILLTTAAWVVKALAGYARSRQTTISPYHSLGLRHLINRLTLIDVLLLVWFLLALISLVWTQHRSQALTELRVIFIEPLLFYIVFRASRLTRQQYLLIVDVLIFAGFIVAVIGLFQYLQGESIITAEAGSRRLASVYGSPNNVALFLGRCIPFALAFVIAPIDRRRRVASLVGLIIMGIALVLTQSVGGIFIGVPFSVALVLLLSLRRRARYLIAIFIVIVVVGFVFSLQSERFARVLDFTSGTNFYRVRAWLSAVNIIHDHPITGLGLDQFLYAFRGKYILPDAWQEPNLSHPHNILLDFWVRLGIVGVILLGVIEVRFWQKAVKIYRHFQQADKLYLALVIGVMGSMVNLLGHGMIDNSVFVQDLSYVFVLLLAIIQIGERAIY